MHEPSGKNGGGDQGGRTTAAGEAVRVLTWNLFHGRDAPPVPELFTRRSRILRRTERGEKYVQVNRSLFEEFAGLLCGADWDVALLQECPPRWARRLAKACGAEYHRVFTARNILHPISGWIARLNPDWVGSWEGGSNTTLVRPSVGSIEDREHVELRPFRHPERRMMALTRITSGLCVANLHASTSWRVAAEELVSGARHAIEWAGDDPLVFGGDFNVRVEKNAGGHRSDVYDRLADEFHLTPLTEPTAIDHLLAHDLEVVETPHAWPPEAREINEDGLALRLSDHAPVSAVFRPPGQASDRGVP